MAANVADLHSDNNKLSKENSLTEKGEVVKGRGDTPNQHDILTGTNLDGTGSGATCNNWTSSAGTAARPSVTSTARVAAPTRRRGTRRIPRRAAASSLRATGGEAYFYCFAAK